MASSLLPWVALGTLGYFALSRSSRSGAPSPYGAPVDTGAAVNEASADGPAELEPGVRYLFVVRLEATPEHARQVLEGKKVEGLQFVPASEPAFWVQPDEPFSTTAATFMATAQGRAFVTLGDPFYGVGRLEKLVRLDGLPFGTGAP